MKICLISNLFPPISRGGAEKVAKIVADGLKLAGHEVFVISTKPWSGFASLRPSFSVEKNLKVYRFYPLNIFYYLNDYKHNVFWRIKWHFFDMFNLHSRAVVKKILEEEKPDIVMTHNLKGIGYLIPRAIRRLGIKHVHTIHDVQLAVPSGLILKGQKENLQQKIFLRKWYEAICRKLFDSLDAVVTPSKWLLDFYDKRGFFKNSKKFVLPNPVVEMKVSGEYASSAELCLLYLGQIEKHKGVLFLVEMLKKVDINFKLHIVGDGSKMNELRKMVGNDQRFVVHGKMPQEKIAEIFSGIDLTVVPSLCYENSPTVIYESLAAGIPVLAAKIGGVAELVRDNENGFTFEAGNADDFIRSLKHVAANRDELKKMRLRAAESVKNFKIENYIQRLLDILR